MNTWWIAWGVVGLTSWRWVFRLMSAMIDGWGTLVAVVFMSGYFAVVVGPLILVSRAFMATVGIRWDHEVVARKLAGESDEDKVVRLEKEARQREARIVELEREVKIP